MLIQSYPSVTHARSGLLWTRSAEHVFKSRIPSTQNEVTLNQLTWFDNACSDWWVWPCGDLVSVQHWNRKYHCILDTWASIHNNFAPYKFVLFYCNLFILLCRWNSQTWIWTRLLIGQGCESCRKPSTTTTCEAATRSIKVIYRHSKICKYVLNTSFFPPSVFSSLILWFNTSITF